MDNKLDKAQAWKEYDGKMGLIGREYDKKRGLITLRGYVVKLC